MEASIQAQVERELLQFDAREDCSTCRRTMLVGEPVHVYRGERLVCDMCRASEHASPILVRHVHGPAFGHTIRIIDQRKR